MKSILFADLTTPREYDPEVLATQALGGSEATTVRVAEELANRGHTVTVAQHCRKSLYYEGGARYTGFHAVESGEYDAIIAMRTPVLLPGLRKNHPNSKIFLHCQDFNQGEVVAAADIIRQTRTTVVCVSRSQLNRFADAFLNRSEYTGMKPFKFIYNPIDDSLQPDDTKALERKLVFFSSPHKGLDNTLRVFAYLKRNIPMLSLYVSNPGYVESLSGYPAGVINLGTLPHCKAVQHVREAFCVLNLNDCFPETFGIVTAEAMAVGTPILSPSHGATPEVIGQGPHSDLLIDVKDEKAVLARLERWYRDGRPHTPVNPAFRTSAVTSAWEELLS